MAENETPAPAENLIDMETLLRRSTPRQWLLVQRLTDMTREEIGEDQSVLSAFFCFLLDPSKGLDYWLDAPLGDIDELLASRISGIEDEEPDAE